MLSFNSLLSLLLVVVPPLHLPQCNLFPGLRMPPFPCMHPFLVSFLGRISFHACSWWYLLTSFAFSLCRPSFPFGRVCLVLPPLNHICLPFFLQTSLSRSLCSLVVYPPLSMCLPFSRQCAPPLVNGPVSASPCLIDVVFLLFP